MRTESNSGSKGTFKTMKLGFLGLVGMVVVYYVLLFIFGIKYLDPEYYGSYFYAWRVNFADKIMTHGRYKLIKKNEHPDTEDRKKFYKISQDETGPYLIRFDRPEHFPRGHEHQFTLNFPGYEDFLKMRERFIVESEGLQSEMDLSHSDLIDRMKKKKEGGGQFLAEYKGKSIEEMKSILFPKNNEEKNPWFEVSNILINAISNIMSDKAEDREGYLFDGEKIGDKMMKDIRSALEELDSRAEDEDEKLSEKISDSDINNFFINNGRVSATPHETFAYSRIYYLFNFLTAGIEFKSQKLADLREGEDENEFREERMNYVANLFARIFSSIYPNQHRKDVSSIGVLEKIRNYYSPKTVVEEKKEVDEEDLNLIKDKFSTSSRVPA
ncbi:uncharacterized protein Eint_070470 [Encephalitozoon intestinalis ATCC 50506]|uniref:Uncharacterized protein n=1 Tax=Encephalitozoon intestinalis (strain ATCC 50506) TaxID=876142 RepID=E0S7X6_ENCIT|nr:uncharacterized protein Eint_070470 [Encephalitozoon intestinalis ATCC 50506]ADM11811.1 hypothetical protein Eint_070470 [Encephalitozoon intestinalis ATCC 50506]UTX45149.1 hypothetical protein GPK93_04g06890 [Encephalitozoon intestinalis]UTX45561.1 hypothetical protein GPK93_07g11240 [Encephalitozoon intestinalis]